MNKRTPTFITKPRVAEKKNSAATFDSKNTMADEKAPGQWWQFSKKDIILEYRDNGFCPIWFVRALELCI